MKILGIGVDIIKNQRISKSIKNEKFLKKIYNNEEIIFSRKEKNKNNFFAKRFAAKESFSKALGTGIRGKLSFRDIIILNDKFGKPFFKKTKKIDNLINNKLKKQELNNFFFQKVFSYHDSLFYRCLN